MPKSKDSKPIPKFESEDAERDFWAEEDSTDYVDWSSAKRMRFPSVAIRPRRDRAMGCRDLVQWLWLGALFALPALGQSQGKTEVAVSPSSAEAESCVYVAKPTSEIPQPELEPHEGCAVLDENGDPKIRPSHLEAISFDDGLASVLIPGQWYYLRPDGSLLAVPTIDNGPDDWREGLVRTVRDGRIGFANRDFELVIEPLYDWAWPFEDGLALVCRGCRIEEGPGEHSTVVDGRWGVIDRSGGEVLPVAHSAEAARKFLRTSRGRPVAPR